MNLSTFGLEEGFYKKDIVKVKNFAQAIIELNLKIKQDEKVLGLELEEDPVHSVQKYSEFECVSSLCEAIDQAFIL